MLLSLLLTAVAAEPLWPDLSEPPSVGGGSEDAAVVVAIEDYVFVGDIPGAKANGLDWYSYFTDGRGIAASRVKLVTDHNATKEEIEVAVKDARSLVGSEGTLWFVFIGHGAPSNDGQDGLLVGSDTQQSASSLYARGIMQDEVFSLLEAGSQAQTVAILDACFSGQSGADTPLVAGLQPMIPSYALSSSSRSTVVLSAGTSKQFAGPLPGADRPAFSYLALGALWGWGDADADGTVTTGEVHEYALEALSALPIGRQQTPAISGEGAVTLSLAQQSGPRLSAIRRALEGEGTAASKPEGTVAEAGSGSALGDALAELEGLQAEEEARAQRAEELQLQLDAEILRLTRAKQREATNIWGRVSALAERGGDSGTAAIEAFLNQYEDASVVVGSQSSRVDIPEVEMARALLILSEVVAEEPAEPVEGAVLSSSAFPASGASPHLIVGTGRQYEPMFNTTGTQPSGFDIDLAHALAERLGKTGVTFRVVKSARNEAAAGQVDIGLQAISITPERRRQNTFSIPYLSSRFIVVAHPDSARSIRSTQLQGMVCAVGPNALYKGALRSTGCMLESYSSNVAAMQAVAQGAAQLTVTDEIHAQTLTGVVNTQVSTGMDQYGIAMMLGNQELKDAVDEILRQMQDDGTLSQLRMRHGI